MIHLRNLSLPSLPKNWMNSVISEASIYYPLKLWDIYKVITFGYYVWNQSEGTSLYGLPWKLSPTRPAVSRNKPVKVTEYPILLYCRKKYMPVYAQASGTKRCIDKYNSVKMLDTLWKGSLYHFDTFYNTSLKAGETSCHEMAFTCFYTSSAITQNIRYCWRVLVLYYFHWAAES